ncbi:hypothetical protein HKX48_003083 [Thoreauomyces humboldtii]|nr:hypothetical protein HKX48_003083 [Thoreauomyces humboldtii]
MGPFHGHVHHKGHLMVRLALLRASFLRGRREIHALAALRHQSTPADPRRKAAAESPIKYKAPKNTIVLCHGLLGFDVMGPSFAQLHYWRGVKEALNAIGCEVIITKVPRAADVTVRARVLKETLDRKVPAGHSINLVAHSMGGLDCRYMISHLLEKSLSDRKFTVDSLTTIGTPHHGSSIASLPFISTLIKPLIKNLHRSTSLDIRAFTDLTPEYLNEEFNPSTPDDPTVSYFSYGADGTASVYDKPFIYPFRWTFEYLMVKEGINDGLVSVESSRWGEYVRTLKADHVDLINLLNTWQWRDVVKSLDAVDKAKEALKEGTDEQGRPIDEVSHKAKHGELNRATQELSRKVDEKKGDLEKEVQEKKFNAIELYLEIATTLAEKGF